MITEVFGLNGRIYQLGTIVRKHWRFRLPWTLDTIRSGRQTAINRRA